MTLSDPAALRQAGNRGAVQSSGALPVEVLDGRWVAQLGGPQSPGEAAALPGIGFFVDQQPQAILEAKLGIHRGRFHLIGKSGSPARMRLCLEDSLDRRADIRIDACPQSLSLPGLHPRCARWLAGMWSGSGAVALSAVLPDMAGYPFVALEHLDGAGGGPKIQWDGCKNTAEMLTNSKVPTYLGFSLLEFP